jgi:hypothetical protein
MRLTLDGAIDYALSLLDASASRRSAQATICSSPPGEVQMPSIPRTSTPSSQATDTFRVLRAVAARLNGFDNSVSDR